MFRKKTASAVVAVDETSSDFLHSTAGRIGPLLHAAADRVGPLAVSAADRVGPLYTTAAGKVSPLYTTAAGRVVPLYTTASGKVTPLYTSFAGRLTPVVVSAAGVVGPYAVSARQRGAQAATGAAGKLGPAFEDVRDRGSSAVDAARGLVSEDVLPRVTEALSAAAAAPLVTEATKRGRATLAAAKGDLALPEPETTARRGWLTWAGVAAAVLAAAAVAARKYLDSSDADWQSARPSAPYTPPTAGAAAATGPTSSADAVVADDSPTQRPDATGVYGGSELGLGDDVEAGEHPTPPEDRDILPSDPITVLVDKKHDDDVS